MTTWPWRLSWPRARPGSRRPRPWGSPSGRSIRCSGTPAHRGSRTGAAGNACATRSPSSPRIPARPRTSWPSSWRRGRWMIPTGRSSSGPAPGFSGNIYGWSNSPRPSAKSSSSGPGPGAAGRAEKRQLAARKMVKAKVIEPTAGKEDIPTRRSCFAFTRSRGDCSSSSRSGRRCTTCTRTSPRRASRI